MTEQQRINLSKGRKKEKWKPEFLDLIVEMALDGATDKDMYTHLGISHTLFYRWLYGKYENGKLVIHPKNELVAALKAAKTIADVKIENALYKSAQGFFITEEQTLVRKDDQEKEIKEVRRIKKYITPNSTSQIFWLKNRQPNKWRDKREDLITLTSKEDIEKAKIEINKIIDSERNSNPQ